MNGTQKLLGCPDSFLHELHDLFPHGIHQTAHIQRQILSFFPADRTQTEKKELCQWIVFEVFYCSCFVCCSKKPAQPNHFLWLENILLAARNGSPKQAGRSKIFWECYFLALERGEGDVQMVLSSLSLPLVSWCPLQKFRQQPALELRLVTGRLKITSGNPTTQTEKLSCFSVLSSWKNLAHLFCSKQCIWRLLVTTSWVPCGRWMATHACTSNLLEGCFISTSQDSFSTWRSVSVYLDAQKEWQLMEKDMVDCQV